MVECLPSSGEASDLILNTANKQTNEKPAGTQGTEAPGARTGRDKQKKQTPEDSVFVTVRR